MNSRSKKYHEKNKADDGSKKGSANNAGYDEQNEITSKSPKANPAPSALKDKNNAGVTTEKEDYKIDADSVGQAE
ncbi:MAG: hypothetical protein ABIP35_14100 [Ginsengibacter sp.]